MTSASKYHVEWLTEPDDLQTLKSDWQTLEVDNPQLPFYASYRWHLGWLKYLEPYPEKCRFLVLRKNNRFKGVLPLREPPPQTALWKPSILETPHCGGMDLSAPILDSSERLLNWWPAIRQQLKTENIPSFAIRLNRLLKHENLLSPVEGCDHLAVQRTQGHSCHFNCQNDYENLHSNYSTRLKKILKRGYKRAANKGKIQLITLTGDDAKEDGYRHFLQLEATGWKKDLGTALVTDAPIRRFHELLFFENDPLRRFEANLLLIGDQCIAVQLCLRQGKKISLLKIAHDNAWRNVSPGSIALDQLLQRTGRHDDTDTVDLVTGQAWMDEWGTERTPVADLWLFDRSISARVVRSAISVRDQVRRSVHS